MQKLSNTFNIILRPLQQTFNTPIPISIRLCVWCYLAMHKCHAPLLLTSIIIQDIFSYLSNVNKAVGFSQLVCYVSASANFNCPAISVLGVTVDAWNSRRGDDKYYASNSDRK